MPSPRQSEVWDTMGERGLSPCQLPGAQKGVEQLARVSKAGSVIDGWKENQYRVSSARATRRLRAAGILNPHRTAVSEAAPKGPQYLFLSTPDTAGLPD